MNKKIMFILLLVCGLIGCSNRNMDSLDQSTDVFYFSTDFGGVYEYNQGIHEVSNASVHTLNTVQQNGLFLSNQSTVNFIESGLVTYEYNANSAIQSATSSQNKSNIYFVNQSGVLYVKNVSENTIKKVDVPALYPIPKQIILDDPNNRLFYHNGQQVFQIDLDEGQVKEITADIYPIASIAYHQGNDLYFSTSTDGKIYKSNISTGWTSVFYHPISVNGSLISIQKGTDQLFFSKGNGRDTHIYELDLTTKASQLTVTLSNIKRISQLTF